MTKTLTHLFNLISKVQLKQLLSIMMLMHMVRYFLIRELSKPLKQIYLRFQIHWLELWFGDMSGIKSEKLSSALFNSSIWFWIIFLTRLWNKQLYMLFQLSKQSLIHTYQQINKIHHLGRYLICFLPGFKKTFQMLLRTQLWILYLVSHLVSSRLTISKNGFKLEQLVLRVKN